MKKILLLFTLSLILVSCFDESNIKNTHSKMDVERLTLICEETGLKFTSKVYKFEYDGHLWYRCSAEDGFHHHPDCPCIKKKEESLFNW